jgi:group I intron endonuclease
MTLDKAIGTIYGLRLIDSPEFRYVGLTTRTVSKRWAEHRYASRYGLRLQPVYNWILKHGEDSIEVVSIEEVEIDSLFEREIHWVAQLRLEGHRLLNATIGGDGGRGRDVSESTRQLISKIHSGKVLSEGTKQKLRESKKGQVPWNKGMKISDPAALQRMSEAQRGRVHSEETKAKMSQSRMGNSNGRFTRGIEKRSGHTRYHTNTGISKPETCKYCKEETTNGQSYQLE